MSTPLKDGNRPALFALFAANLALLILAVKTGNLAAGNWTTIADGIERLLPAGVALVLTSLINAQLSPLLKARIVFFRWRDPLPGSEAFTRYGKDDPRVNLRALESKLGPLPSAPAEQNALWYKLFRSLQDEPAVTQAHKAFLLTRDYCCLMALMFPVVTATSLWLIPSWSTSATIVAIIVAQFLLSGQAARNHGRRLVSTVLAIKSSES